METDTEAITAVEMCNTWHRKRHTRENWEVGMQACELI
jgi:hypothetical protein